MAWVKLYATDLKTEAVTFDGDNTEPVCVEPARAEPPAAKTLAAITATQLVFIFIKGMSLTPSICDAPSSPTPFFATNTGCRQCYKPQKLRFNCDHLGKKKAGP